jgi:branched-chain amino acid transport system substrate-binding protein
VIYTDDTQGKFTGLGVIANVLKKLGVDVKTVPVAPNASDFSAAAASAIQSSPDMVYVNSPNACPGILKALKSVGNQAKIFGIDPCTSPPALKAAGDAAEGLYFAQPFDSLDSGTADAKLMLAVVQKYGPKDLALDSIAQAGFNAVMNVQTQLNDVKTLDTKSVLAAFKNGKANPNFLAHDFTCDGKQLPGSTAVCNAYQKMKQVKGGKIITVDDQWVTGAQYYTPPPAP